MAESKEKKEGYIRALLEERAAYEVKKNSDGVASVDAELQRLGAAAGPPAKRAATRDEPAKTSPRFEERGGDVKPGDKAA